MNHLVSVIVPVYNVEKYIDRCIDSIVNQTYENLEIILVDDGSLDDCPKICNRWARKDKRVKVIHKKNGGLSDARNVGLEAANGEYIMFVDSDDWISLEMAEKMLAGILENDADMAICQFFVAYSDGTIEEPNVNYKSTIIDVETAFKLLLQHEQITNHAWRKMYKKALLSKNPFPVGRNYEDVYTVAQFFIPCKKIVNLSDAYYYYFQNSTGITKTMTFKSYRDIYYVNKHRNSLIIKNFPQLKQYVHSSMKETQKSIVIGSCVIVLKKIPFVYEFFRLCKKKIVGDK